MRIISSFKDYYDNAISSFGYGYGEIDPKLVYVREKRKFNIESLGWRTKESKKQKQYGNFIVAYNHFKYNFKALKFVIVGFCGKLYYGYNINFPLISAKSPLYVKYWYSFDKIVDIINGKNDNFINAVIEDCKRTNYNLKEEYIARSLKEHLNFIKTEDLKIFKCKYHGDFGIIEKSNGRTISDDVFIQNNSPIIVLTPAIYNHSKYDFVVNDSLDQYGFMSKFDTYSAFQEISMYLGNNLVKQVDPSVNFSDELKRDIAGFDNWSFKKFGKNSK